MEPSLFDDVAVILRGLVPEDLGEVRAHARRWGIKVWFGAAKPAREHFEAQVLGRTADPAAKVLALEVGFHAEHPKEDENAAVLERLLAHEVEWRDIVGEEPVAGAFLGRAAHWRRISETWPDPDLSAPDIAFEVAARITDYVVAIEPLRRT
ncbi:MAG TPA: hypothetical protein VF230_07800 [Acidimicrobiales bacterium]